MRNVIAKGRFRKTVLIFKILHTAALLGTAGFVSVNEKFIGS